ncbi:hypothetical protein HPC49_20710 [Pyxidicoccus fallax]|uniref:Lipoprotein n=1 Tax=Pyxidicoccus fallax TaxID=394095 RepID=A0A848LQ17_9BACT|nr:hypothetical protein [Pyxidicoccus fallax]NMO19987.1 hypothetical protein [Pyxidicoccus fallax]NPC80634.1 hypothetical protein [Pyxidicoccus fallax]
MSLPGWSRVPGCLLVAMLMACSGEAPGGSPDDASTDAGEVDAGEPDAGAPDAGPPDGGPSEPDAGPPDGGPSEPDAGACHDDDPCTAERWESGQCVYPAAPDGTGCDDREACTAGDRCVSGVCRGEPSSRPAETFGTLWSHGAAPVEQGGPPLKGLAESVSDDRILFGEPLGGTGLSVSLVRVGPQGLERLDQRVLDLYAERFLGSWDWSDRFTTFFVPLGPDRVVVVGTRQRLELLGLEGDRLTSLSRYALHPSSDSIVSGVGRGDRFWTCSGYAVTAWRVGADHALSEESGHSFQLPGGTCRSLALSPDGNLLWAATSLGLVPVEVSSPSGPVIRTSRFTSQAFFHVRARGAFVVAHELLRYGELGRIFVYRAADLTGTGTPSPVETFAPMEGPGLWERPLGFVLLDGELLVEWFRLKGTLRSYTMERHSLTSGGVSPVVGRLLLREGEEVGLHLSPLLLTGAGRHAVPQPWRRVLTLEDSGAMRFQTGLHHGALERVRAAADGTVLAMGPFESHRVDVSNPEQPALTTGGMVLPPETRRLRLAPSASGSGALELVTLPARGSNVHQEDGTAVLSCLRPGAGVLLEPAGQVSLAGGPAALAFAQGQLFQVSPASQGGYRLRRFVPPSTCTGAVLAPASERTFALDGGAGTRTDWAFAVDGERSEVLLGEVRFEDPAKPARLSLRWSSWTGEDAATGVLSGTTDRFTALALARGRALVIENGRQVHLLERQGMRLVTRKHVDLSQLPAPLDVRSILAFDGDVAYLALATSPFGVVALGGDDLAVLARYTTPSAVRSLAFSGEWLVLGMNDALTVATPACGGSQAR